MHMRAHVYTEAKGICSVLLYHAPPCSLETVSLSLELGWERFVAPNSVFLNAGVTGLPWLFPGI